MTRCTRPRRTAAALAVAGLGVLTAGCGAAEHEHGAAPASPTAATPAAAPAQPATPAATVPATPAPVSTAPAPSSSAQPPTEPATDDGSWHARVVRAEPEALVLDRVELLSGAAAAAARVQDGLPDPDADVPYVRNRNDRLRTLPVAPDVDLQVVHCPQDGCTLTPWRYADLVSGTPLPYGTPDIPFTVTVADGSVVALSEVYLP